VEEYLQVIRNGLKRNPSFSERSRLQVEDAMELLDVCLTTTYFQFEDKFYQQKEGMAMGNSLPPVVSNIFMEHFEEQHWIQQTTNPLNGSDTSTALSWFSNMDQQDCNNFFTISTALYLPSNSQWRWKLIARILSWMSWS
jgi:hypothetical protein